jgi:hypothetical protein
MHPVYLHSGGALRRAAGHPPIKITTGAFSMTRSNRVAGAAIASAAALLFASHSDLESSR